MPSEPHALPSGHVLREYRIERVLGAGGFGITYLARDVRIGKRYAVKEYLPRDFASRASGAAVEPLSASGRGDFDWGMERFLGEARALAQFAHPSLVGVVRYFRANGTAYIVMEYVEGELLSDHLAREAPLSEPALRGILEPLMDGLSEVHAAGYLHRDIKPENIVLRAGGTPVLLDFGAARMALGGRSRTLTAVLTPGYAPIEQYSEGSRQGAGTDIYALGAVAYHALTGERPQDATERMLEDRMPALSRLGVGGAGRVFLEGVDAALRLRPEERPVSLASWRRRLDGSGGARVEGPGRPAAARDRAPARAPAPPRADGAGGRGRRLRLGVGLALGFSAALLGLAGAVYWFGGPGPPFGGGTAVAVGPEVPEPSGAESAADGADDAMAGRDGQDEVSRLLAAAELDLEARRLTQPEGNNAWERYSRVLDLSPGLPEALAGLERVLESYVSMSDEAISRGGLDEAAGHLARVRGLNPDAVLLAAAERRLAAAREAEAERQAVAERQAELELLTEGFDRALGTEDLDGAADYLAQLRELGADVALLTEWERRLEEAERQRQADEASAARLARLTEGFDRALEAEDIEGAIGYLPPAI